jgi:tetratricopeptide (TPR) repeat protein
MVNLEKFKEKARKFEQKEQWAKAIEEYVRAIEEMDAAPETEADLSIFNRVGDLYQKVGDSQNAVTYYERAVDKYAEGGLANNAIALCNKIMRLAPGRSQIYLKLGMLFASKGFAAEAKTNLLEYADRMQKAGQLEEAFKALKKFAEMTPGQDEIWSVLAQQARASAKTPDQKEQVDKLLAEFEAKDRVAQHRKSRMSRHMLTGEELPADTAPKKGDLIFLDLEPTPPRRSAPAAAPPAPAPPPPPPPAPEPEIPALEIEATSLAEEEEAAPALPALEIVSTSLAADETPPAGGPALELEPTSLAEPEAPVEEELRPLELEVTEAEAPAAEEPTAASAVEGLPMLDMEEPTTAAAEIEMPEIEMLPAAEVAAEPAAEIVAEPMPEVAAEPAAEIVAEPVTEMVAEPVAEMVTEPVAEMAAEPEAAPPAEIELEPFVEIEAEAPAEPAVESAAELVAEAPASVEADVGPALEFLHAVELVVPPTVEELEARIAQSPDDWEAHRLLGEAIIETGERERGIGELDAALEGQEQAGQLDAAYAIAEEVLRLDPNSVRHHQKRVELAYRQGDRPRLADAYLELADALLRSGEADKAVAVYQRVLEHDPSNARAKSAIETLAPPPPPKAAAPKAPAPFAAGEPIGGFVDLGAMLLDEASPKDTRMRIEDEEPSGDEQKDFQTMLTAFKKGVEANVEEEDFQSHYDLGVAYKEMGLLDEAIAEFQKALRGSEGRLRASEALGLCFFEKGQFAVAETILKRGLDLPAHGDADRVGLLYWLGRSQEELSKAPDALASYNRVFAVDITFQDVSQRVKALSRAGA